MRKPYICFFLLMISGCVVTKKIHTPLDYELNYKKGDIITYKAYNLDQAECQDVINALNKSKLLKKDAIEYINKHSKDEYEVKTIKRYINVTRDENNSFSFYPVLWQCLTMMELGEDGKANFVGLKNGDSYTYKY